MMSSMAVEEGIPDAAVPEQQQRGAGQVGEHEHEQEQEHEVCEFLSEPLQFGVGLAELRVPGIEADGIEGLRAGLRIVSAAQLVGHYMFLNGDDAEMHVLLEEHGCPGCTLRQHGTVGLIRQKCDRIIAAEHAACARGRTSRDEPQVAVAFRTKKLSWMDTFDSNAVPGWGRKAVGPVQKILANPLQLVGLFLLLNVDREEFVRYLEKVIKLRKNEPSGFRTRDGEINRWDRRAIDAIQAKAYQCLGWKSTDTAASGRAAVLPTEGPEDDRDCAPLSNTKSAIEASHHRLQNWIQFSLEASHPKRRTMLQFGAPSRREDAEVWATCCWPQSDRFIPVTETALLEAGARHYAWVRPGEGTCEHGGFAYSFGEQSSCPTSRDCVFPCHGSGGALRPQPTGQEFPDALPQLRVLPGVLESLPQNCGCDRLRLDFDSSSWILNTAGWDKFQRSEGEDIQGHISPKADVTFDELSRRIARIPESARYFVWASQSTTGLDTRLLAEDERQKFGEHTALYGFFSTGSFIYLNENDQIVAVNALGIATPKTRALKPMNSAATSITKPQYLGGKGRPGHHTKEVKTCCAFEVSAAQRQLLKGPQPEQQLEPEPEPELEPERSDCSREQMIAAMVDMGFMWRDCEAALAAAEADSTSRMARHSANTPLLRALDALVAGFTCPDEETQPIAVASDPDPATSWLVLSCADDLTMRLWDMETQACIRTLNGQHTKQIRDCCVYMADDHRFKALSCSADHSLCKWDLASGECELVMGGVDTSDQNSPSSHERSIAKGHSSHRASVPARSSNKGHTDWVNSCCVFKSDSSQKADNRALSSSSDNTMKVWDLNSGNVLLTFGQGERGHRSGVMCCRVIPAGGRQGPRFPMALSSSRDHTLKLWSLEAVSTADNSPVRPGNLADAAPLAAPAACRLCQRRPIFAGSASASCGSTCSECLQIVESRQFMITNPSSNLLLEADKYDRHTVQLWRYIGLPNQLWEYDLATRAILNSSSGLALNLLDTADQTSVVGAWTRNGQPNQQWIIDPHSQTITNPSTGKVLGVAGGTPQQGTRCVASLLGHSSAGRDQLWKLQPEGARMPTRSRADGSLHAAAEAKVEYAQLNKLGTVDHSVEALCTMSGHADWINGCHCFQDSNCEWKALSCSDDHTLRMWDISSAVRGVSSRAECKEVARLVGHTREVVSCTTFTEHGRVFAISASRDCWLRIWCTDTARCVALLSNGFEVARGCCVYGSPRTIVSCSAGTELRVWDFGGEPIQDDSVQQSLQHAERSVRLSKLLAERKTDASDVLIRHAVSGDVAEVRELITRERLQKLQQLAGKAPYHIENDLWNQQVGQFVRVGRLGMTRNAIAGLGLYASNPIVDDVYCIDELINRGKELILRQARTRMDAGGEMEITGQAMALTDPNTESLKSLYDQVMQHHQKLVDAAIENGRMETMNFVNAKSSEFESLDLESPWKRRALSAAAFMGHTQIVQDLLEARADCCKENADVYKGRTALFFACAQGHAAVVETLLLNGSSICQVPSRRIMICHLWM